MDNWILIRMPNKFRMNHNVWFTYQYGIGCDVNDALEMYFWPLIMKNLNLHLSVEIWYIVKVIILLLENIILEITWDLSDSVIKCLKSAHIRWSAECI